MVTLPVQTVWMLVNIGLFIGFFIQFQTFDQYFYMRQRTKVCSVSCLCAPVYSRSILFMYICLTFCAYTLQYACASKRVVHPFMYTAKGSHFYTFNQGVSYSESSDPRRLQKCQSNTFEN